LLPACDPVSPTSKGERSCTPKPSEGKARQESVS
jgi:hypothetical protein